MKSESVRVFCSACGTPLDRLPPAACAACGTKHWNDAKPCASALVVSESRLLLVRRAHDPWKDMWDVPGGFCDPREHPTATARREVFEETGLRVRIVGFLGIWLDQYPEATGLPKHTLNVYYHAVPDGPVAVTPDVEEVLEARFFLATDLPAALAFPDHVPAAIEAWKRAAREGALVTPLLDGLKV
jgi:ADP-ribose pyrophosphatase YjhB (NUDIX family)